jgi:hypothetical protein
MACRYVANALNLLPLSAAQRAAEAAHDETAFSVSPWLFLQEALEKDIGVFSEVRL